MDRLIQTPKKKRRLIQELEWFDLIPYSIALVLLLAEISILCQFLHLYDKVGN